MKNKNTPSGIFNRSAQLFAMATRVAAKELGSRLVGADAVKKVETRIEQARIIAQHLSHLKGAAMKAGQLLSLDTSDFLPPEAIEILSKLQSQATAAPTHEMQAVLLRELGPDRYAKILHFSDKPKASASIGQLHSAEIGGKRVALKIQYPGVAESIDSDLAILKKMAEGFAVVAGKKFSLDDVFAEISDVLKRETDYEIERLSLEKYKALLKDEDSYIVPTTYADYSTKRVLAMSYEDGQPVMEWARDASPASREHVARLVLDLFCKEFCDWGFVQTDPNFANFMIRDDVGLKPRLLCLDFGATLSYSEDFRSGYARLLRSLSSDDADTIFQGAVDFGLIDPRESSEARVAFKEMIKVSMEPFSESRQPFQFSDPSFEKRTVEANMRFSRSLVYSPPPRKIIFLHRKLGGIFNLVKRLGAVIDLREYWQHMTVAGVSSSFSR